MCVRSKINLSPQGLDQTTRCRAFRVHYHELRTSGPGQSSARCDPGIWRPTGEAVGEGPKAAPGSLLLDYPADRPPDERESRGKDTGMIIL